MKIYQPVDNISYKCLNNNKLKVLAFFITSELI